MALGHECEQCWVEVKDENGKRLPPTCVDSARAMTGIMRALLDKVLATPKHDDAGEARTTKSRS